MALLTRIAKFALLVTVTAAEKRAEISGSIDQTSTVGIDSRTVKSRFQTIPFTNQDHLDENQRAGSNSTRTVHPPVGLPRLPFTTTTPSNQPTR